MFRTHDTALLMEKDVWLLREERSYQILIYLLCSYLCRRCKKQLFLYGAEYCYLWAAVKLSTKKEHDHMRSLSVDSTSHRVMNHTAGGGGFFLYFNN